MQEPNPTEPALIIVLEGLVWIKKWNLNLKLGDHTVGEQQENMEMDPYTTFVYGIRSPYPKESYCRRLRSFFDAIY